MKAVPTLAVAALHGAVLLTLWPAQHRSVPPAARRELAVRLLPAAAARVVPAPLSVPLTLVPPTVAAIAPPAFDVMQADVRPVLSAAPMPTAAAPEPVALAAPPARRDEPPAAEPTLQSARRTACAPAPHPLALRERGIEGVVRLRVWVDELGHAGQVLLAASSGWRLFDDAAVAQARRCPFQPALRGIQPVGSWVEFPVRFALETPNG